MFACINLLEKLAVSNHHYWHFSLSRIFYMLLVSLILIVIIEPKVITTSSFRKAMSDPSIFAISLLTTVAMITYYMILTHKQLWMSQMTFPIIVILTILAGSLFLKEKITLLQWTGILITFVGTILTYVSSR